LSEDSQMIDLILRNAKLAGQDTPTDLGVTDGVIVAIGDDTTAAETIDLGGRLVTAPLVEPHIHLDAALTVGQPRPNVSGSLFEGIAIWADRVADLSYSDVQSRVSQILRWQLACGVQHVRSHVDVCDPELRALRALVDLREQVRGLIDLQLVAFPQQGILGFDGGRELMRKAVQIGADVVGGIPHYELTREDGVESVRFAMALADEHGLRVDRRERPLESPERRHAERRRDPVPCGRLCVDGGGEPQARALRDELCPASAPHAETDLDHGESAHTVN